MRRGDKCEFVRLSSTRNSGGRCDAQWDVDGVGFVQWIGVPKVAGPKDCSPISMVDLERLDRNSPTGLADTRESVPASKHEGETARCQESDQNISIESWIEMGRASVLHQPRVLAANSHGAPRQWGIVPAERFDHPGANKPLRVRGGAR